MEQRRIVVKVLHSLKVSGTEPSTIDESSLRLPTEATRPPRRIVATTDCS
jgi:hypothetical protein